MWIEPILVFGFEPIAVREYVLVRAQVGGEELLLDEADQPADVVGVAHVRFWREYNMTLTPTLALALALALTPVPDPCP